LAFVRLWIILFGLRTTNKLFDVVVRDICARFSIFFISIHLLYLKNKK
jgi:hypothetical protein